MRGIAVSRVAGAFPAEDDSRKPEAYWPTAKLL